MKKIVSLLLAFVLTISLSTVAFAAQNDQDAQFTKTYRITNEGTTSPAETFTFAFTAESITDSNSNLGVDDMPEIPNSTVDFAEGAATTEGTETDVSVALSEVEWPGVGIYVYKVKEVAGSTAGVVYDEGDAYLKVTVAYDEGTDTYYTAFVTMALDDSDNNGITDVKAGGFTNEYQAGKLEISKTVEGNMADPNAYFKVTVTLTGEAGKTYAESYSVTGGSYAGNPATINIGTPTDFYLRHDETITIANLPYGVTYSVVEADYTTEEEGGYDAAKYSVNGSNAAELAEGATSVGEELDTASESVAITNSKGVVVDTGIGLDSLPYIMLLAIVFGAAVLFVMNKRRSAQY